MALVNGAVISQGNGRTILRAKQREIRTSKESASEFAVTAASPLFALATTCVSAH